MNLLILSYFDGGNHASNELCVITDKGKELHFNQALFQYPTTVSVKSIRIKNNKIILNILFSGQHDGACCPTEKETLQFAIKNDKIIEIDSFFR